MRAFVFVLQFAARFAVATLISKTGMAYISAKGCRIKFQAYRMPGNSLQKLLQPTNHRSTTELQNAAAIAGHKLLSLLVCVYVNQML